MHLSIRRNQWILLSVSIWALIFGCSRGSETLKNVQQPKIVQKKVEPCSYLQDQTGSLSICKFSKGTSNSKENSKVVEKIDLKARLTEKNSESVSSVRFQNSESVTELDLSDNSSLTSIPDFVMDLPNLTQLNVSNTNISDWDNKICQLKKLEKLIGRNNSYKGNEVPFHTFCLESLTVLDMSNSNVQYIDEYIHKLSNLKEVYMSGNHLEVVPYTFHLLPELTMVDFTENSFQDENLNSVHSCKDLSSAEQEECQKGLKDSFYCEWWQELSFQRGEPLRRYEEMTNEEYSTFLTHLSLDPSGGFGLEAQKKYNYWLNWEAAVPIPDGEVVEASPLGYSTEVTERVVNPEILERTINGKTVREWRYYKFYRDQINIFYRSWFDSCEYEKLFASTKYLPSTREYFPERFHNSQWTDISQQETE